LDLWKKYLPRNFVVIGIFRHPLKVAESLKTRNQFEYSKSLELWKIYNQKLLDTVEKNNGFLLDFDWPKGKLLSELKLIFKKIGLVEDTDLSEWYTPELFFSDKKFDSKHPLSKEIKIIYSKLKQKSKKNKSVKKKKVVLSSKENSEIITHLLDEIQQQGRYFKKLTDVTLNSTKTDSRKTDPLSVLLSIYNKREDLQKEFPEVHLGNYEKLVGWAVSLGRGTIKGEDYEKRLFSNFLPWYKKIFIQSVNWR